MDADNTHWVNGPNLSGSKKSDGSQRRDAIDIRVLLNIARPLGGFYGALYEKHDEAVAGR